MKTQNLFILPGIGWLVFTTVLLTLPMPAFPKEGWFIKIPMLDKWVHIVLFIIMAVLFCWAFFKRKNKVSGKLKHIFITIGICCLVYGIVMEFVQKYFVPNRSFDIGDIVADGAGAAVGVVYSIKRYIKK